MKVKSIFYKSIMLLVLFISVCMIVITPRSSSYNSVIASDYSVLAATLTKSQVTSIQTKLKRWGYYNGPITGYYGSLTTAAVKYFQRKNGLAVDGIVGPKTAAKLGIKISSSSTTSYSNTSSDTYLLAKCIHAEARGESYVGQVAIGAVILNRVKSSKFPNSISGVIYQPYAFTCVSDGQINLSPNDTALKAAKDAINGWDPTYGSIYYYNASTATSKWIFSRKTTVVIGKHTFAV